MASTNMASVEFTPEQLATLSTDEIESILHRDQVNLAQSSKQRKFQNWAKTFSCDPERVFRPSTPTHVLLITELARRHGKPLRAAGVGHSPSDLACTSSWQVRTNLFSSPISILPGNPTIAHVQPGIILHNLHRWLKDNGTAISNCGSISDQTLAGVITTCTHGSGWDFPVLTSLVEELGVVVAGGDTLADGSVGGVRLVRCSKEVESDLFHATICGLGLTGIITDIKIRVEPAFRLREVKTPLPMTDLLKLASSSSPGTNFGSEHTPLLSPTTKELAQDIGSHVVDFEDFGQGMLDRLAQSAEHVRLWYYPQSDQVMIAQANRIYEDPIPTNAFSDWWGKVKGYHMTQLFLFIAQFLPWLTSWVGRWVWWLQSDGSVAQDDGYKVFTFDCLFPQYTTEWAIPYEQTRQTLVEIRDWLRQETNPVHWPIEIRFSEPDDIWLSPSYGRRTTWIGIVQYRPYGMSVPYERLFERFTTILKSHDGRPHWAKQHDLSRERLVSSYPKFEKFCEVRDKWDPANRWACEYGERHFGKAAEGLGQEYK